MAPSAVDARGLMTNGINGHKAANGVSGANGKSGVDTMNPHEQVHFHPSLKPKNYEIKGTDPNSKVLFRDVNIIDSSGSDPFKGDVYIEGKPPDVLPAMLRPDRFQANGLSTSAKYPTSSS